MHSYESESQPCSKLVEPIASSSRGARPAYGEQLVDNLAPFRLYDVLYL